jgi:hypothetical protein
MPKARRKPKPKKSQLDKFKDLARQLGADESESAFIEKIREGAKRKPPKPECRAMAESTPDKEMRRGMMVLAEKLAELTERRERFRD